MSGFELTEALNSTLAQAEEAVRDLRRIGIDRAGARADYRAALRTSIMTLRNDGKVPATLVPKIAEGSEPVNGLAKKWEILDVEYEAKKEIVMLRKREADTLREQIQREWTQSGMRRI